MKFNLKTGSAIAAAAATIVIASAALATPMQFAADDVGHCVGANACKGQGACKTGANACKGQNACKGKGFVEMVKAECEKIQGATFDALHYAVRPKG